MTKLSWASEGQAYRVTHFNLSFFFHIWSAPYGWYTLKLRDFVVGIGFWQSENGYGQVWVCKWYTVITLCDVLYSDQSQRMYQHKHHSHALSQVCTDRASYCDTLKRAKVLVSSPEMVGTCLGDVCKRHMNSKPYLVRLVDESTAN